MGGVFRDSKGLRSPGRGCANILDSPAKVRPISTLGCLLKFHCLDGELRIGLQPQHITTPTSTAATQASVIAQTAFDIPDVNEIARMASGS